MRTASTTSRSSSTTSTSKRHVYVYCAVRGVPSSRSLATLPFMPGGSPPRALPLTAANRAARTGPAAQTTLIVSDVPAELYSSAAVESRLGDLDWVTRCGTVHHAVADQMAKTHAVVPFRLFTLFSSDAKAVAAFARRAPAIAAALQRVSGKAEWVLKIIRPAAGAAAGEPRRDGDAVSGTSFLQKKAAARQAAAETARQVIEEAARVHATLAAKAAESTVRDVEGGAGVLLDASFLVPSRRLAGFKRTLTRAAEPLLAHGCRVSLTGPWPPYSFVSLAGTSRG